MDLTKKSENGPLVWAVIPVYNRVDITLNFLKNIKSISYQNLRVVVVDDGSTDSTDLMIRLNFPNIPVLAGHGDLWWSGATNMGIRYALDHGAEFILTINDDSEFEYDFLDKMLQVARQNKQYIVGCRIHRQDKLDTVWSIGTSLILKGSDIFSLNFVDQKWADVCTQVKPIFPVDCMPGNGVLFPRSVFDETGFYNENSTPQYHADSDLVLRAVQKNYQAVIATKAVIYNHIISEPLVDNVIDLIFSKKSDRYWRACWLILSLYAPLRKRYFLMVNQYLKFLIPARMKKIIKPFIVVLRSISSK